MLSRAVELCASIDAMAQHEKQKYDKYLQCFQKSGTQKSNTQRSKKKPKPPSAIIDDMLTADDWDAINQYLEILEPLKQATERLEGRAIKGTTLSLNLSTDLTSVRLMGSSMGGSSNIRVSA